MARWAKAVYLGPPDSNWGGVRGRIKGFVEHIAEGSYAGTIGWMQNTISDVSSHFVIDYDGTVAQMLDTDFVAWTEAAGNPYWVSAEFAGFNTGSYTPAQQETASQLYAWLHQVHGVPLQLTDDVNIDGWGWHGMGGVPWGNHPNCPGVANVGLRASMLQRTVEILSGDVSIEEEEMHFAREPNGSVWWVGIGFDPVSGKPYRRGVSDPFSWGRWEDAGFTTKQCSTPMAANDWVTLPATGPTVSATATISDAQVKIIADAVSAGAAAGAGNLTITLSGSATPS